MTQFAVKLVDLKAIMQNRVILTQDNIISLSYLYSKFNVCGVVHETRNGTRGGENVPKKGECTRMYVI